MRIGLLVVGFIVSVALPAAVCGQTVEVAAKCDALQKQLAELVKKPGPTDAQKIKEALGLDILDSCPTAEGQIICFQCVDKDQHLRTLQLLQRSDNTQLQSLGFGCRCRQKK